MPATKTEDGYIVEKQVNAGIKEIKLLATSMKLLPSPYYITKEAEDRYILFTDSLENAEYRIDLVDEGKSGPIVYHMHTQFGEVYGKTSKLEMSFEVLDDIQTMMTIKAQKLSLELGEQMKASMEHMEDGFLENVTNVMMDLTIFQSIFDSAVQTKLPYIRDAYIIQGDYVGAKVDIVDSVLNRSDITVGTAPPDGHIRTEGRVEQSRVEIKDTIVNRTDINTNGDVSADDSIINRSGPGQSETTIKEPSTSDDPNLVIYRQALEKALADGAVAPSEENLLSILRQNFGITQDIHDRLVEQLSSAGLKNISTYRQLLEEALKDGSIDPSEEGMLENLRKSLGITDELHTRIMSELQQ